VEGSGLASRGWLCRREGEQADWPRLGGAEGSGRASCGWLCRREGSEAAPELVFWLSPGPSRGAKNGPESVYMQEETGVM
jgi:hypothetical protein